MERRSQDTPVAGMLTKQKRPLFSCMWGMRKASVTPLTVWGSSVCPRQRARVKGRRRSAVLLRSMAALLHLEAGAEDRPAAPVRQIMGAASHKADDGGPEGRHDAMRTDTAEPALTGAGAGSAHSSFHVPGANSSHPPAAVRSFSPLSKQSRRSRPEGRATARKNWQRSQLSACAGRDGVA